MNSGKWNSAAGRRWSRLALVSIPTLVMALVSCSAFNPAFVDVVLPGGSGQYATIDNSPGHVVIQLVNNAEVNERLLSFLESPEGGGLVLTDAQKQSLRPRVRLRVLVTFTDASQTTIELIDGSKELVSPNFNRQTEPDLNQNDLDNAVVLCDVQRVELLPDSSVEVFIPVPLQQYEILEVVNEANIVVGFAAVLRETIPPMFRPLEIDQIDMDGNVLVQRNIGIRNVFSPVNNLLCGSVVTVVLEGELSVPFLDEFNIEVPSFDQDDPSSVGSIGGRYEFVIGVQ